ncbi:MAG: MBL fold metallo-hydrolase, partial [Anaerolineales bacterium]
MEIIPSVYQINVRASNCILIVEEDDMTLVDAGVKNSLHLIEAYLRQLGKSPTDLTRILLTHADLDHVGSATALKAQSGATIYASQIAADALAEGHSSRQLKMGIFTPLFNWFERRGDAMRVDVDEILTGGDTLPVLGGLEVLETPGHTPGHISFYTPSHKLLIAGDSVSTQPDKVHYNRMKAFN